MGHPTPWTKAVWLNDNVDKLQQDIFSVYTFWIEFYHRFPGTTGGGEKKREVPYIPLREGMLVWGGL